MKKGLKKLHLSYDPKLANRIIKPHFDYNSINKNVVVVE